jgi:hypothetical protein
LPAPSRKTTGEGSARQVGTVGEFGDPLDPARLDVFLADGVACGSNTSPPHQIPIGW